MPNDASRPEFSIRLFRKGLRELEREVELALAGQSGCCGVTPAQCHLLLAVEEAGEISVGELAGALELDSSTLSRSVDSLVKAALLVRKEDAENRRRQLVSLSAGGKAKADPSIRSAIATTRDCSARCPQRSRRPSSRHCLYSSRRCEDGGARGARAGAATHPRENLDEHST
jgi:DNA-binding MarR family transcriptional regulator